MRYILGIPKLQCQGIPNSQNVRLAYMETWNKRLKIARKEFGCNQSELAKAVGVSNATVSDWENGVIKNLEAENLLKICDFLSISPNWLQFGKGLKSYLSLSEDDYYALSINRNLNANERKTWYRVGKSLAEHEENPNTKQ